MTKLNLINLDNKNIIEPYFSNNNYDIYIFQQNSNIQISFSISCQGDIIIVGPGGDGGNGSENNGGIGSAIIYKTNLTFFGKEYSYKLGIPLNSIPYNSNDYSSKTYFTGPNIDFNITAQSVPQKSLGFIDGKQQIINTNGGKSNTTNICNHGQSENIMPITYSPINFWLGGAGSGGNTSNSGIYGGNGGIAGHGVGGENQSTQNCFDNNKNIPQNAFYIKAENEYDGVKFVVNQPISGFTQKSNTYSGGTGIKEVNTDAVNCSILCSNDNSCVGFMVDKYGTKCWLKKDISGDRTDKDYDSYIKSKNSNTTGLGLPGKNDIFAGNGGGGGGKNTNGGKGSPGLIIIIIKSISKNILTFSEYGYNNIYNVNSSTQILGKNIQTYSENESENENIRESVFSCPSEDNKKCIDATTNDLKNIIQLNTFNLPPMINISELKCNYSYDVPNVLGTFKFVNGESESIDTEVCQNIYNAYNLYPTANPLAVIGNDHNANITNTITNSDQLISLASKYQNKFTDTNSDTQIIDSINQVLQETPLKLACCKRMQTDNTAKTSNVKVSLCPGVQTENKLLAELDYQNKVFNIPNDTCPVNLYRGSEDCNVFYASYCQNFYNYLKSKGLSNSDILLQIPECACYFPNTVEQEFYPSGTPSICYKDGCNSSASYLDPSSIKPDGTQVQCDMTVCQNIVNTAGLSAGGDANITPTLQNNCGPQLASSGSNTSGSNTSGSNTSGSNTSGSNTSGSNTSGSNITGSSNNYIIYIVVIIVIVIIVIILYFVLRKTSIPIQNK